MHGLAVQQCTGDEMDITPLRNRLHQAGQEHLLRFYDQLDDAAKKFLVSQLESLDLKSLSELAETYVKKKPIVGLPKEIKPVEVYPRIADASRKDLYAKARRRGDDLIKTGKIAAFVVAGGQGTRLGYDGPKGQYPVTPIQHKPLFQVFAEQLLAHQRLSGRPVPWYVMTSDVNDAPTRAFFQSQNFFGLNPSDVFFFQQGMMPAYAMDGKLLLGEKGALALSPDGHGGSLRALAKSGALADMRRRGVEHLSYFQVDNPLVQIVDAFFLGLHDLTGSEMSSKTVSKAHALERVGNFVIGDGKLQVIEYSDLPHELAKRTGPGGKPLFNAASIGIHALCVEFVEQLNSGGRLSLPWHRAEKKVPYVDEKGTSIKPEKPNAVKLEQFVFDAIPLAERAIVVETERGEEFSPVKNATGDDSPETCTRDQIRRAARWLKQAGVKIPMKGENPDAVIEISPLFAVNAEQLAGKSPSSLEIPAGRNIYLA